METRGVRNCNPCNIRKGGSQWEGLREEQRDGEFCQFQTMTHGLRAVFKLLQTYYTRHGCRTLAQVIYRWAPPQDDNDTEAYLRQLTDITGRSATELLPHPKECPAVWKRIVCRMCWVESRYRPTWQELEDGYTLAFL